MRLPHSSLDWRGVPTTLSAGSRTEAASSESGTEKVSWRWTVCIVCEGPLRAGLDGGEGVGADKALAIGDGKPGWLWVNISMLARKSWPLVHLALNDDDDDNRHTGKRATDEIRLLIGDDPSASVCMSIFVAMPTAKVTACFCFGVIASVPSFAGLHCAYHAAILAALPPHMLDVSVWISVVVSDTGGIKRSAGGVLSCFLDNGDYNAGVTIVRGAAMWG